MVIKTDHMAYLRSLGEASSVADNPYSWAHRRIRELEAELQVRDDMGDEVLRILREATGKRDFHSEMEAAEYAAGLIRASGWRPMNTAPRDGRDVPVLVKLGGKVEWRQLFASSGGEYWVNHGGGHLYRESECIAWFELPAPPAREVPNDGE